MGIVHAAIYDAALAIEGGYKPYAIELEAPRETSAAAAVATAAHDTLIGLQPALGLTPAQQAILDGDYAAYLGAIPDGEAKANGIAVGEQVAPPCSRCATTTDASAIRSSPTSTHRRQAPVSGSSGGSGAGSAAAGDAAAGARERFAVSAGRPELLDSGAYANDFAEVEKLGARRQRGRTPDQTTQALLLDRPRSAAVERRHARPRRGRGASTS